MKKLVKGQVIQCTRDLCTVQIFETKKLILAKSTGNLKYQKVSIIIGDIVEVIWQEDNNVNVISKRFKRKNKLERPKIANVEASFIVTSVKEPKLDFIFLIKVIIWIQIQTDIKPILIFTKTDLIQDKDKEILKQIQLYTKNYQTILINYFQQTKINKLQQLIQKTSVFLGRSGVGKSTLLNLLNPKLNLKTKAVSFKSKLGTHQTSLSQYLYINNQLVADTPGFNKITLSGISKLELLNNFPFFSNQKKEKCHFQPCFHDHEPKCAIKKQWINEINKKPFLDLWQKLIKEVEE